MKIQVISLFPEMFAPVFNQSMLWKAQEMKAVSFEYVNLRDYGLGNRKTVDDTPYGGGDGMLLKPEPIFAAVEACKANNPDAEVILMTPRGELFKQSMAIELSRNLKNKIIICGRYEGYDERITTLVDKQISVGNYVLTGGEIPAMILVDAVVRLIPGVLGGETSVVNESFQDDDVSVEHPQYTRPEVFRGLEVPSVLLSGNHAAIDKWRNDNGKRQK